MKKTRVSQLLGIEYPILQAGLPWVSNPELVAAISNVGGMGILHPTAGMSVGTDTVHNLRENIRRVQRLTSDPFGISFYLGTPEVASLMEAAAQEGMRVAITYGGSPALYTDTLKSEDVIVIHQVGSVRHARGAEAQGVDIVIAQGFEGAGFMSQDALSTLVLVPQVADTVSIPIIASGGIMDARGFAAAMTLGAQGVQMGTRFVATHECIAHPRFKEALLGAIDTGTVIAGWPYRPTRVLRTDRTLRLRDNLITDPATAAEMWESELGMERTRATLLDGDLEAGVAFCGAGAGLVSEIQSAEEVVRSLVDGLSTAIKEIQ